MVVCTGFGPVNVALRGQCVKPLHQQTIFLTTYRTRAEGGQGDLDTEAYEALIVAMAENGVADFVDVELDSSADAQALFARVHEAGGKVIASHHDFEKTPATVDMISMMSDMYELGADVAKLAVMPQSFSDVVAVLDATVVVHQSYPNQPKITISMGKLGAITRLLGESVGSCLTFGTVGRASAPGQMEYKNVARALDSIHVCLSKE